ncbi:uncharacterized protein LOC119574931 [Penaeus monodon]|uniref:uncharacterized protein LOC119574931 n=1 Tax=Penaeus monodon TaxID=6687 RepID=UPI0018A6E8DF|nr:uncharacterized protein LOC119574931 [Penaeus monodon]XP_037778139.1 uncharacterized protein LOC119574931 [Penaeus monodon]XP_037778140.1 uncharacterized protein LOC119574931 [Penaeus monodon]XP_037778142.1 uncharacterized protein LOC119574931 [Penaeus monodon]XP_037778143.1 uncharacterized protein LOC119574931 [Penaeus monodon]XP_037778144.1 uncharacterized protein LOC119574931 [Penaeus monodon]XP_037778145.1 uncharacterized protein LOC119574931 [Penaeus monodon]XP_037778146.1 uncharacte
MEPAQYQIPLVVSPPRQRPWQRLYLTPTHSSAAHARAPSHAFENVLEYAGPGQQKVRDSLEWRLGSLYDHEKDLFKEERAVLRRRWRDKRECREGQAVEQAARLLHAHQTAHADLHGDDLSNLETSVASGGCGPRVVAVRVRDSLATSLLYSPRPTHTLTVPKATPGYARNPNGAFFTS